MKSWQTTDNQFDFSITHSIEAPKEAVYQVLADMEAYPQFVTDLISVKREGSQYTFLARAAILTISATLAVTQTPGQAIAFELVDGPVDTLTGHWLIEAGDRPQQTKVTLALHVETHARGQWLLRMTGKFVQNKTDKLITAFSNRVLEMQYSGTTPTPLPQKISGVAILMAWFKRQWDRLFNQAAVSAKSAPAPFADEHGLQTLEALAATILPPDDVDGGVQEMGFVSVVEIRSRYEAGRQELYKTALTAVDKMAQSMFNKPGFIALTGSQRTALLDVIRQDQVNSNIWGQLKPSSFFSALWEDAVFLYCTHPDSWQRIGFPGPSFQAGGYQDFDQTQTFLGRT